MSQQFKTYFNWSSGKDSALALYQCQQDPDLQIDLLLTTVNAHFKRVSMHGLREEMLVNQAQRMGLSLDRLYLPENPSMEVYNQIMDQKINDLKKRGYRQTVFGDIFLEDLKKYREQALEPSGISPIFPLWMKDTRELIEQFFDGGFKAKIICINGDRLSRDYLGEDLTSDLIADLPESVDPCGENGEFHTFCYDGPIFREPVPFQMGEKTYRHYNDPSGKGNEIEFGFCDLVPV